MVRIHPAVPNMTKDKKNKPSKVFVHSSAVREAGLKYLNEGDELTFEVESTEKGPAAVKLQKTS